MIIRYLNLIVLSDRACLPPGRPALSTDERGREVIENYILKLRSRMHPTVQRHP